MLHITGPTKDIPFGADVHDFQRGCPCDEGDLDKLSTTKTVALIFGPYRGVVFGNSKPVFGGSRGLRPGFPFALIISVDFH